MDFSRSRECTKIFSEWIDFGKIRVMYTNLQILRSIPSALSVTFPNPVRAFFAALDLTHLNPFTLIAGECVNSSIAKYDTLVIVSTVLFGAVCVLNWLAYAIRACNRAGLCSTSAWSMGVHAGVVPPSPLRKLISAPRFSSSQNNSLCFPSHANPRAELPSSPTELGSANLASSSCTLSIWPSLQALSRSVELCRLRWTDSGSFALVASSEKVLRSEYAYV